MAEVVDEFLVGPVGRDDAGGVEEGGADAGEANAGTEFEDVPGVDVGRVREEEGG